MLKKQKSVLLHIEIIYSLKIINELKTCALLIVRTRNCISEAFKIFNFKIMHYTMYPLNAHVYLVFLTKFNQTLNAVFQTQSQFSTTINQKFIIYARQIIYRQKTVCLLKLPPYFLCWTLLNKIYVRSSKLTSLFQHTFISCLMIVWLPSNCVVIIGSPFSVAIVSVNDTGIR